MLLKVTEILLCWYFVVWNCCHICPYKVLLVPACLLFAGMLLFIEMPICIHAYMATFVFSLPFFFFFNVVIYWNAYLYTCLHGNMATFVFSLSFFFFCWLVFEEYVCYQKREMEWLWTLCPHSWHELSTAIPKMYCAVNPPLTKAGELAQWLGCYYGHTVKAATWGWLRVKKGWRD